MELLGAHGLLTTELGLVRAHAGTQFDSAVICHPPAWMKAVQEHTFGIGAAYRLCDASQSAIHGGTRTSGRMPVHVKSATKKSSHAGSNLSPPATLPGC